MREKEVSDVWMLEETTTLDKLIIHEGAQIHTPDGKFVAMTINGSGAPIAPGTYYGDIVLTVADTCHMPPHGLMKMMNRSEEFRCALVINNNEIVKEQSVNELIKGGLVNDHFADGITIQSSELLQFVVVFIANMLFYMHILLLLYWLYHQSTL